MDYRLPEKLPFSYEDKFRITDKVETNIEGLTCYASYFFNRPYIVLDIRDLIREKIVDGLNTRRFIAAYQGSLENLVSADVLVMEYSNDVEVFDDVISTVVVFKLVDRKNRYVK